ncbi:hypothetical protein D187_003474 [Cystobacter fuscus DSM 2262]|uniref:Uncharacterized protein n=1 Tax=Cystobacter fuscus (strain ATCC 25194 / DSM 2262 / NBRC 100088 / M29) TaxID=1242864 RepID=S9PA21_CYSF2|nr:hypothetical protein [Cystobacter fuscus]EPX59097.1 hypothetical protein D187_003474 [Cystobacter fuscus DSM 2262]
MLIYLERWSVEESNRFLKQGFDLEDVRTLNVDEAEADGSTRLPLVWVPRATCAGAEQAGGAEVADFKAFGPVPMYLYYRLLEGIGHLLRATMDGGP